MSKNYRNESFNEILLDSIDEALESLGESVKASIYFHLEKSFMVKRQDIPHDVDGFSNALERIFGLGAQHLEILIIRGISAKVNGPCWIAPDLTFQQHVKLTKLCYEDAERTGNLEVG